MVCTVRVSYAEARAAFARHRRDGALTAPDLRRLVRGLDEDWSAYQIVDVTDGLVRRAGALCERYALRAFDALQLAAALELRRGARARSSRASTRGWSARRGASG